MSSEEYFRRPSLSQKDCDREGWNRCRRECGGKGWRVTSWNRDCHRASNRVLNNSKDEGFTISPGFTPLQVNFKNMTAKPRVGGGSKHCVAWKVEKAVRYAIHTDVVTKDYENRPQALERCLTMDKA